MGERWISVLMDLLAFQTLLKKSISLWFRVRPTGRFGSELVFVKPLKFRLGVIGNLALRAWAIQMRTTERFGSELVDVNRFKFRLGDVQNLAPTRSLVRRLGNVNNL